MKQETIINQTKFLLPLLLLSLVLIFAFSVKDVSAAPGDVIFVNGSSGSDSNTGYTPDQAKLTVGNATGTVNNNGLVSIADGTYSGINNTNITINKNMTIIGESQSGTIINGTDTNWIFDINNDAIVTIMNLTLANGTRQLGGAINNAGNLTVLDCTFIGNDGWVMGGAIANSANSNAAIINCNFINNIQSATGSGDGGAAIANIFNNVQCIVTGCNFIGNTAYNGGAILNNANTIITNSIFTNNIATFNGGAIYSSGTMNLASNTFTGNHAYEGGVIDNEGIMNIFTSIFNNNYANLGGAIWNNGALNLTSSNFTSNNATDGGALANYVLGNLNVTESTFLYNTAMYGGVIYGTSTVNMHFNRIVGNTATVAGDAINALGPMNVIDNWWGSNAPAFSSLINGESVTYSPWLYLTFSAIPTSIPQGSTSTLTASFNQDTDGTNINSIDPNNGHIPDGSPVTFTTTLGNVGSKSVLKYTTMGIATATLRADEAAGDALVGVTADGQTLTSTVTITPVNAAASVNAASSKTVGMQTTGAPIVPLAIGILSLLGGLAATRRK